MQLALHNLQFPIAWWLFLWYVLAMDISRKDAENLFNDDGTVNVPVLSMYLHRLPHLWNLSRQVGFLVSEKLMASVDDGGWREDRAKRAIAFSAWLNEQARVRGNAALRAAA